KGAAMSDQDSTATSRVKDADANENTTKISSANSTPDTLANVTAAAEPVPTVANARSEPTVNEPPSVRDVFKIPEQPTDVRDDRWQTFQKKLAEEAKGIKWTAAMPD